MEDWSLQAIVRGQSGDFTRTTTFDMDMIDDCEILRTFSDNLVDAPDAELEDLYKPFYPAPVDSHLPLVEFQVENTSSNKNGVQDHMDDGVHAAANSATKYKRRKNQQKREVIHVTADGLDADMWAWRKYGQKPIKGSPYPRSYYRCSSSKGCLARKQVEQNCAEPGTYIITYTAEHSHSQPTRRNSLAGTVRQKFPTTKNPQVIREIKSAESSSSSPKHVHNQSINSSCHVMAPFDGIKKEEEEVHFMRKDDCNLGYGYDDFIMRDFVLNEDFFSGLEEFDEFMSASQHPQKISCKILH